MNLSDGISLVALTISLGALIITHQSAKISQAALGITRATSKVDLEPTLAIDDYMGTHRPAYLMFFNYGPIPAMHVTMQLFQLAYNQNKKMISCGMSEMPQSFYVPSIQPQNSATFLLNPKILTERYVLDYADAMKMEQPYYNDILEVRVRYYREVDGKMYGGRKFFYRTAEGEWARENVSSFPKEVLSAALKWHCPDIPPFFKLNPLNP